MDGRYPLVVSEVSPEALEGHNGIIANLNRFTVRIVVTLKPLHGAASIRRVVVSTYQAVSDSGQRNTNKLGTQIRQIFDLKEPEMNVYPHHIALNCTPRINILLENDYTKGEIKAVHEIIKIICGPNVKVTTTYVCAPVFYDYSEPVNIETEHKLPVKEARVILV